MKNLRFRAIKQTLLLLSTNLEQILQEDSKTLVSLYEYISHLSEFRKVFFSQYIKIQRLRISDSLKSIEIELNGGSEDNFPEFLSQSLECLARFLQYDLAIWKGLGLRQSEPNIPQFSLFEALYQTNLVQLEKSLQKRGSQKIDFSLICRIVVTIESYAILFEKLNQEYLKELSQITGMEIAKLEKIQKCQPIVKIQSVILQTLNQVFDQLNLIERHLVKLPITQEIPISQWNEVQDHLKNMSWFFANLNDKANASSALTVFKPLMTFTLRFREEKVLLSSKIESLRFTDNIYRNLVLSKSKILQFLPKLPEKLEQLLRESIQDIFSEVHIRVIKTSEPKTGLISNELQQLSLDLLTNLTENNLSNPWYHLLQVIRGLSQSFRTLAAESYLKIITEKAAKIPTDESDINKRVSQLSAWLDNKHASVPTQNSEI